ncbi:hypothetical protein ACHAXR_002709 [Thalassiosira sp. AJA248-18]
MNESADVAGVHNGGGIFINLTVPPGAEAGVDSLTFEYDGNEVEVMVPDGSVPGDVLRIQVGVRGDRADDDCDDAADGNDADEESKQSSSLMDELGGMKNDEPAANNDNKKPHGLLSELGGMRDERDCSQGETKRPPKGKATPRNTTRSVDSLAVVEMGNGLIQENGANEKRCARSLHLLESLPGADKAIRGDHCNEGDGTNGVVWASGTLLAQALTSSFGVQFLSRLFQFDTIQSNSNDERRVKCLELGSGLGVCGLALAHAFASCCKSNSTEDVISEILLTDHGEKAVNVLKENIKRNSPSSIDSNNCRGQRMTIAAESLIWGNAMQSKYSGSDETFQLILGSDLLYNTQSSYDPLIETIKQHLHPKQGIIILAVRWRKPDLERVFFQKAEMSGLKFDLWKEFVEDEQFGERCPCILNWREYGNPQCESSNRYFHETTVPIAKTETSLANIKELDMESMKDEEYSKFEELQIQIYVGKFSNDVETKSKRQRMGN